MIDDLDFDSLLGGGSDMIEQIDTDPQIIAAKRALATEAAAYAQSIAPQDSGDYKDSIGVYEEGTTVGVIFADPAAAAIEYGTEDTPEFAVRARTEEHFNSS